MAGCFIRPWEREERQASPVFLTYQQTYPHPRRADEPQALSAEWDSHTAEGAALFRPTDFEHVPLILWRDTRSGIRAGTAPLMKGQNYERD